MFFQAPSRRPPRRFPSPASALRNRTLSPDRSGRPPFRSFDRSTARRPALKANPWQPAVVPVGGPAEASRGVRTVVRPPQAPLPAPRRRRLMSAPPRGRGCQEHTAGFGGGDKGGAMRRGCLKGPGIVAEGAKPYFDAIRSWRITSAANPTYACSIRDGRTWSRHDRSGRGAGSRCTWCARRAILGSSPRMTVVGWMSAARVHWRRPSVNRAIPPERSLSGSNASRGRRGLATCVVRAGSDPRVKPEDDGGGASTQCTICRERSEVGAFLPTSASSVTEDCSSGRTKHVGAVPPAVILGLDPRIGVRLHSRMGVPRLHRQQRGADALHRRDPTISRGGSRSTEAAR